MGLLAWLAWQAFLVCGIVGYGRIVAGFLGLRSLRNRLGSEVILGMLTAGAIGSTLSLTPLRGPLVWTAILLAGVVRLGWDAIQVIHVRGSSLLNARIFTAIGALAVYAVLAAEATLKRGWNACDDAPAYFYLARRFWEFGELLDPFNNRRLTSFGTGSFFQGLFMGPFGDNALNSFDEVIGAVLLASFAFSAVRAKERAWMFLLPIPLLLNQSVFGLINSSPTFAIFAILLVVLTEVLSCLGRDQAEKIATTRLALFAFVLLTLLRPTAGFVLLPIIGWLVLVEIDQRRSLLNRQVIIGLVASFLPWSLLQWRDSGTPFFPVFSGYASEIFPLNGFTDRVAIGPHLVENLGQLIDSNFSVFFLFGGFAAVGIGWAAGTRRIQRPWFTYAVIVCSSILVFLAIGAVFRRGGFPLIELRRFTTPVLVAAGLAPVFALSQSGEGAEPRLALRRLGQLASVLVVASVALGMVLITIRDTPSRVLDGSISQSLAEPRFAKEQASYAQVRDRLPDGSNVLAAVDLPHLLLDRRYSLETYDIAGAMAPRGEFPFDGDLPAQQRWLAEQGVDYLVVQRTGSSNCLYSSARWTQNLNKNTVFADWTPYALSWFKFTDALQNEPGRSERFGDLVVIPVSQN
ncbi:MAG: hypothetical protein WCJ88_12070 [Actinomycetes bacterium]